MFNIQIPLSYLLKHDPKSLVLGHINSSMEKTMDSNKFGKNVLSLVKQVSLT